MSRALGLRMLPGIVAKAHLRGDIHWHDLDYSPVTPETNCCLIDFDEMFKHGFKIGNAWVFFTTLDSNGNRADVADYC